MSDLRILRQAAILYAVSFGLLGLIIFATPGLLGTDDYYHAQMGLQIIVQGRLGLHFPWLPQTILSPEAFVDHHLLYHLFIAPWVYFGGVAGAKLAATAIASGVVLATWGLLRQIGVRGAALWALGIFALSTPFLYRMLMIRTQGASLLLLIVALILMFAGRYRWLIPLAFAYAWLYNGFVLLFGIAALYSVATWISDRRFDLQAVVYVLLGTALGLIINPYFPANVQFIVSHLGAKVDLGNSIRVGNEWYPYSTGVLMTNSAGALLAMIAGWMRPSFGGQGRDRIETALLLAALLTLFMVFRSRRFIEYFPAFALLYAAAAWGRGSALDSLVDWLPRWGTARQRARLVSLSIVASGALGAIVTLNAAIRDAQSETDLEAFAGASAWLKDNTPAGALVFQTDWDDFTRLFYYNTHNVYLIGLDPTYLQLADPIRWALWVDITQGRIERPSSAIYEQFAALYVVSDTRHDAFEAEVTRDSAMALVYQDRYSYVWQIDPERLTQSDAK